MKKLSLSTLLFASALVLSGPPAHAAVELITNGNFSQTYVSAGGTANANVPNQLNYNGYGVTGWTSSPSNAYNFLFNPSLAGSAAYSSIGQYGTVQLYTSNNGGSATAPASLVSPVGGNFLALDGAFQTGPLSQVVFNLSIGAQYNLSFFWAAGQQAGFDGTTTESLGVSFGNQSFSTATVTNPEHGFTPWTKVSYTFVATSSSQTLSFLAAGGPSGGQAPFSLLDGVSLQAAPGTNTGSVPDTGSTLALLGLGLGGLALARRKFALA